MTTLIDTNVLVRLIVTNDDLKQTQAAISLIEAQPCSILSTVFLESEWVLRSSFELSAKTIEANFRSLLTANNIQACEPALIQRALDAYATGMDFGDALHAAQCKENESMMTFDKAFAKGALKAGIQRVKLLKA